MLCTHNINIQTQVWVAVTSLMMWEKLLRSIFYHPHKNSLALKNKLSELFRSTLINFFSSQTSEWKMNDLYARIRNERCVCMEDRFDWLGGIKLTLEVDLIPEVWRRDFLMMISEKNLISNNFSQLDWIIKTFQSSINFHSQIKRLSSSRINLHPKFNTAPQKNHHLSHPN
jgi:hypothetical protein